MGTDYAKIAEEAIGQPVEAAGLFEPSGSQYSSRYGGNAAGGILTGLAKHSDRGKAAADLPWRMIIGVTDSQIYVFEAKEKIGHFEIETPALFVLDRGSTTAEKHVGGVAAEGLSLTAPDGTRVEVEAQRVAGHGTDVIKLLVG
ncbi:MAG: hypothetical protein WCO96_02800 [Actinomycetes bacterium]